MRRADEGVPGLPAEADLALVGAVVDGDDHGVQEAALLDGDGGAAVVLFDGPASQCEHGADLQVRPSVAGGGAEGQAAAGRSRNASVIA